MGALANELKANPFIAKRHCTFGLWLETLDEEDYSAVMTLMNDPRWSCEAVIRFLKANGCPCGNKSIRRHWSDDCLECASL